MGCTMPGYSINVYFMLSSVLQSFDITFMAVPWYAFACFPLCFILFNVAAVAMGAAKPYFSEATMLA